MRGEEGQIYHCSLDEAPVEVARIPARPLGFAADGEGRAHCCARGEPSGVYRIDPSGEWVVVATGTPDRACVEPNHPAFLADGTLLYADSGDWGKDNGCVFSLGPDGGVAVADVSACSFPNGLAVSPDGSFVAVVESTLPGVSALRVGKDRSLHGRHVVAELPGTVPDGVAFDELGQMLVSCWCPDAVYLVTDSGLEALAYDPQRLLLNSPTNIAFVPGTNEVVAANYGERFLSRFRHDVRGAPMPRPSLASTSEQLSQ